MLVIIRHTHWTWGNRLKNEKGRQYVLILDSIIKNPNWEETQMGLKNQNSDTAVTTDLSEDEQRSSDEDPQAVYSQNTE